jgi:hypothetical protein
MSYEGIRNTIAQLAERVPPPIRLTLDDGTTITHPGPVLDFYSQAMEEIRRNPTKAREKYLRVRSATGCGLMWQMLAAMAYGPVEGGDDNRNQGR